MYMYCNKMGYDPEIHAKINMFAFIGYPLNIVADAIQNCLALIYQCSMDQESIHVHVEGSYGCGLSISGGRTGIMDLSRQEGSGCGQDGVNGLSRQWEFLPP